MIRMLRNVDSICLCLNFIALFFDLNHWNMGDFDVILVNKIANGSCNLKKNMISAPVKKQYFLLVNLPLDGPCTRGRSSIAKKRRECYPYEFNLIYETS